MKSYLITYTYHKDFEEYNHTAIVEAKDITKALKQLNDEHEFVKVLFVFSE